MKRNSQCCSIELAKELQEFGIVQDSLFYHFPNPNTEEKKKEYNLPNYSVVGANYIPGSRKAIEDVRDLVLAGLFKSTFSAFTVSELSVLLGDLYPSWSFMVDNKKKWMATIITVNEKPDGNNITTANEFDRVADTQADALATLLSSCLKVGHIKPEDANNRLLNS